jgi:hypothetical protein
MGGDVLLGLSCSRRHAGAIDAAFDACFTVGWICQWFGVGAWFGWWCLLLRRSGSACMSVNMLAEDGADICCVRIYIFIYIYCYGRSQLHVRIRWRV